MKSPQQLPAKLDSGHDPQQSLLNLLARLLDDMRCCTEAMAELAEARVMLEAVPLATNEYALARNRLNSAHRYLQSSERGAAAYELRLLLGQLRQRPTAVERRTGW